VEALQPGDPDRVGPYRLLARIGTGGMGVVYLGRSPGGRAVAVKVVRARYAADFAFRARFRREAAAARSVTGVSTAVVLDADPDADLPWLVTAYLPGLTLREAVRAVGALPPATLPVLAAAVAEALVDIHRAGLVHRDLKPANVMVTADGVRVIDFGIARPEDATAITRVGTVIGTPGFMSPEQVSGAPVGPPSDVFSFGSLLMFAATGEEPFRSDAVAVTLHRVRTVETDLGVIVDPALRGLIAACLRADPDGRPTAAEVLGRLGAAAQTDAAWLPPVLAEEIDRRAAQMTEPPADPPAVESGHVSGPTLEPVVAPAPLPRRRLLIGGVAGLVVTAGGVAGAVVVAPAVLRGRNRPGGGAPGPTRSAVPSTAGPPPGAVERWRAKVSAYYPTDLSTTPGVVVVRTPEDELVALDAGTGRELWRHPATLVGGAAGGLVFQAQNTNPELAMLDPVSGATRWSRPIAFRGGVGRLAVCGEVVCHGADTLTALGVADGRPRWTATVDARAELVTVAGLLVAAGRSAVTGLDASTGRVLWQAPVVQPLFLSAGGGTVFVVDQSRGLYVFHAADGTPVWQRPDFIASSAARAHGTAVYVSGGRGEVFALDPATGEPRWATTLGADSHLEVTGGTVLAGTADTLLYGLDTADGRVRWTHEADLTAQPYHGSYAITSLDGQFFVGVREGYVIALMSPGGGRGAGP
jgi:outer membrane protein assembly factor BamB